MLPYGGVSSSVCRSHPADAGINIFKSSAVMRLVLNSRTSIHDREVIRGAGFVILKYAMYWGVHEDRVGGTSRDIHRDTLFQADRHVATSRRAPRSNACRVRSETSGWDADHSGTRSDVIASVVSTNTLLMLNNSISCRFLVWIPTIYP